MKESPDIQFAEYLQGYTRLIAKVARIYCKDAEERKDLIQDIILQLWRSFQKYDNTHAISTWTYRIALNVSISFLRKASTRKNVHDTYHENFEWLHIRDAVVDENLEQLYRFIDLLKPIDKAIMILYLEGCKNKEIAEVMGMTVTNVSTKKQRITEELKSHFNIKPIAK